MFCAREAFASNLRDAKKRLLLSGAPLSDLIANTNVTLIQNNLTGLLAFVNQYYMAGDIFQYSSNNVSFEKPLFLLS